MSEPLAEYLQQAVGEIGGIGPRRAQQLQKRGIHTRWDLLVRPPSGYATFADPVPVRRAPMDTAVLCRVRVIGAYETRYATSRSKRRRYYTCATEDDSGALVLQWFHDLRGLSERLQPGQELYVFGTLQRRKGYTVMNHPRLWFPSEGEKPDVEAYYRGFRDQSAFWYREAIARSIAGLPTGDLWHSSIREELALLSFQDAVRQVHRPMPADLDRATLLPLPGLKRLQFDTLFAVLYALQRERLRAAERGAYTFLPPGNDYQALYHRLPFEPTDSQQAAIQALLAQRGSGTRINAILHGDVGSGKTLVAGLLVAHTVENGYQAIVAAPTEILARQQHTFLESIFRGTPIQVGLLTGSITGKARASLRRHVKSGKISVVVGTHAVFDPELAFARLGLTVVDEQHRFGVAQREALRLKDPRSDLLVMSATPIPRTLLMSVYGDLTPINLDAPPAGRKPIRTRWLRQDQRREAMERIEQELAAGHQVYFVYPRVEEEDEQTDLLSAEAAYSRIARHFGEDRTALLHGQMPETSKQEAFNRFRDSSARVLVSTTVIEVGIDVPNATVMVVQNAERFGIAQLHQIRGRVGRDTRQGWCFLISDADPDSPAAERLQALCDTQDGFALAEKDLELRGAGDLFGERQSGISSDVWQLASDRKLLKQAAGIVERVLAKDPDLEAASSSLLRTWIQRFYTRKNVFEGG